MDYTNPPAKSRLKLRRQLATGCDERYDHHDLHSSSNDDLLNKKNVYMRISRVQGGRLPRSPYAMQRYRAIKAGFTGGLSYNRFEWLDWCRRRNNDSLVYPTVDFIAV